jgi:hypothetical protein
VPQHGLSSDQPKLLRRISSGSAAKTGGDDKAYDAGTGRHSRALAIAVLHAKLKACNGLPKF